VKIYLLRHGETVYNTEKRYLGRSDIPLSPAGREALGRAAFSPEKVYVSPLRRAVETAEVLFPDATQVTVPDFREMDFGIFEGRSYREMSDDPEYRAWVAGNCLGMVPGGECRSGFCQRTCAAFASLTDQTLSQGGSLLAIVAHGGTQMAVMERFALPRRDYFAWTGPFGGGFVLDASRWAREHTLQYLETVRFGKKD